MGHKSEPSKLASAPAGDDIDLVIKHFNDKCNCYSYAVQDYTAGYLTEDDHQDSQYLPRPGQTRGRTYKDLWWTPEGMRRAIHEDGIDFAGMKYPKKIPAGHYVICCFLEPKEYHFIRQNRDGSWSSKDGRAEPTRNGADKKPLINPEDYYGGDKDYKFVGYFFVPEGGVRVGIRGYETRRLEELKRRTKNPSEEREKRILTELVALSDETDQVIKEIQQISQENGMNNALAVNNIWTEHRRKIKQISHFCRINGYTRCDVLKDAYIHPKNAKGRSDR
ncbi:MAG: hypothetical protein IKS41_00315 [Alphaproteobacteria bacterium]|nr:hypothetical protein [Alphaproteobacteria bacterium]